MTVNLPILILTGGGTIDKQYFDPLSEYQVGGTSVARLLDIARVTLPYKIAEMARKLATAIQKANEDRIIVTHGTDTMTISARALQGGNRKTIVFVGALTAARFSESDAAFNSGLAFATAQLAPPGIYIAMNGIMFPSDRVEKDRAAGAFVRK